MYVHIALHLVLTSTFSATCLPNKHTLVEHVMVTFSLDSYLQDSKCGTHTVKDTRPQDHSTGQRGWLLFTLSCLQHLLIQEGIIHRPYVHAHTSDVYSTSLLMYATPGTYVTWLYRVSGMKAKATLHLACMHCNVHWGLSSILATSHKSLWSCDI